MNEKVYPMIRTKRKNGNERINGINGATVLEFWQWAYSNLMDNAERGIFAEWLVAKALGAADNTRTEWDKCDIYTKSGISVEVKSSGYIQSWEQKKLSGIVFNVPKTKGWDSKTNTYDREQKRQADVYVFCVYNHKEQESADPLNLEQWDFYVLDTKTLDSKINDNKTLTLKKLTELGAICTPYEKLNETVEKLVI